MVSSSESPQQQQQQQQQKLTRDQLNYQRQQRYLQQQRQQFRRTSTEQQSIASPINNATDRRTSIGIHRSSKPLTSKIFYLDIKNHVLSAKLEAKIKELGGKIELFLVRNVTVVVTDQEIPGQISGTSKHKWGCASVESGGPPSLRSIEVQTPTPTPPTPYHSVEGPLSNSTNQQGQTTQRTKSRVDAMLERALTQPQQCSVDPLYNARNWDIPIWSPNDLQVWLDKVDDTVNRPNFLSRDNRTSSRNEVRIKHLADPYIKFESYFRDTRPVFIELKAWPTLNFDGDAGTCPFDLIRREKKEVPSVNKEIKENRQKQSINNHNISKGKDMTRKPRAPAVRGRKTENTGYCEICRIDYRCLSKHLESDQHLSFVHDEKNFLTLDNLISTGASVEAFLRINRANDVSKEECNLFSSRDHSLDNGILLEDEKSEKKDKSNLDNCNSNDVTMMQCNGARKNLKLDSPHNLRTRAKHESGHLLRSKGRPHNEEEKSEKSFDKYTIKKRAKGTIWIEENDSEDESVKNEKEHCDEKPLFDKLCSSETKKSTNNGENLLEKVSINGEIDHNNDCKRNSNKTKNKDSTLKESFLEANLKTKKESFLENSLKTKVNGYERKDDKCKTSEVLQNVKNEVNHEETNADSVNCNNVENVKDSEKLSLPDNEDTNSLKSLNKEDQGKCKPARRGGRTCRGRHRLSVEERLIEDNRDYYKVEVLGNKLRSSAIPSGNIIVSPSKEQIDKSKKDDKSSGEKPVVVRFKRVRKSELSLLSDEAESFMFGDPRRDDDCSEHSDGEQSSILPKDTESDREENVASFVISSSPPTDVAPKQEVRSEDESQDSTTPGRARKRRRTQTEALIMDNTDYYKFETPGSRLRYQAPLTGISDLPVEKDSALQPEESSTTEVQPKVYPSKPSPEVEKMHFSFEAVPKSEPWYQTYQRQDEGSEYWHYFSDDTEKPFLLPYEIENFHEILQKSIHSSVHRKRGRSRGGHVNMGSRSPRKSPRCHASTLAIMSTIIRRREQTTTLSTIEEEDAKKAKQVSEPVKSEKKSSEKSDVDRDLNEIVKNLDEMLSSNDDLPELDSFEVDLLKNVEEDVVLEPEAQPKGAPENLLELLDKCHDVYANGIDNSSCASSECGDLNTEFPLKRRKKRKNKTGWPGNKMRRKLHIKSLGEELQKHLDQEKKAEEEASAKKLEVTEAEDVSTHVSHEEESNATEPETGKENEQVLNTIECKTGKGRRSKNKETKESKELTQEVSEGKDTDEIQDKTVLKSVSCDEISPRKKRTESFDKCRVEDDEGEPNVIKSTRTLSSISEDSEASLSNNENLCTKDANSLLTHEKNSSTKPTRKGQRNNNTTSSELSHQAEIENRRFSNSSPKKQSKESSEDLPVDQVSVGKKNARRRSKKRPHSDRSSSKVIFEDENCKSESYSTMNERRRLKRAKRNDSVSSDLQNGEMDAALAERVSPSSIMTSSDVDQRRSSIDFQPVVRVMKIDDQVEMDNGVLSVAVASNRRLRSSSSPRSNIQPPAKRFRHAAVGKRQLTGHWLKNS